VALAVLCENPFDHSAAVLTTRRTGLARPADRLTAESFSRLESDWVVAALDEAVPPPQRAPSPTTKVGLARRGRTSFHRPPLSYGHAGIRRDNCQAVLIPLEVSAPRVEAIMVRRATRESPYGCIRLSPAEN
jgi:hypothetical protein